MKNSLKNFLSDSIQIILIGGALFLVTNIFLGQLLQVTGNSMEPTLMDTEQIIGEKISLNFTTPKRKEIVIFKHPNKNILLIKRIIGLPGETIEISQGNVIINGKILEESYTQKPTSGGDEIKEDVEYKIPEDSYFLLGDNRTESLDGRKWGFIKLERITARALLVYYPIENFRIIRN